MDRTPTVGDRRRRIIVAVRQKQTIVVVNRTVRTNVRGKCRTDVRTLEQIVDEECSTRKQTRRPYDPTTMKEIA